MTPGSLWVLTRTTDGTTKGDPRATAQTDREYFHFAFKETK